MMLQLLLACVHLFLLCVSDLCKQKQTGRRLVMSASQLCKIPFIELHKQRNTKNTWNDTNTHVHWRLHMNSICIVLLSCFPLFYLTSRPATKHKFIGPMIKSLKAFCIVFFGQDFNVNTGKARGTFSVEKNRITLFDSWWHKGLICLSTPTQ